MFSRFDNDHACDTVSDRQTDRQTDRIIIACFAMRHSPAINSTTSILFRSCSGKKVLISANTGITTHVKVIKGLLPCSCFRTVELVAPLKPNSITLSGSKLVRSWSVVLYCIFMCILCVLAAYQWPSSPLLLIMAALWNRAGHYIFAL